MAFTPPMPHIDLRDIPDDISKIDPNSLKSKRGREILKKYEDLKKQKAEDVAKKKAEEKRKKRSDFLLDLFKALIVAVVTLVIEHFVDIIRFFMALLS